MIKHRRDDRRCFDRRNKDYQNRAKDLTVAEMAGVSPSIAEIWRKAGVLPSVMDSPAYENRDVQSLCFKLGGKL